MQDHPTGTPSPSPPCLDKLDVPQLQQDIPKWIPWLSESSQRQWKTFMEQDLRCLQAMPAECDVPWILPDLIFQAGQRNQVSRPVLQFEDIFEEERIESNVSNRKRHATRTYMANRKHIRYAVYTPHLDFQVFTNLKILRSKEFYTTHKKNGQDFTLNTCRASLHVSASWTIAGLPPSRLRKPKRAPDHCADYKLRNSLSYMYKNYK